MLHATIVYKLLIFIKIYQMRDLQTFEWPQEVQALCWNTLLCFFLNQWRQMP